MAPTTGRPGAICFTSASCRISGENSFPSSCPDTPRRCAPPLFIEGNSNSRCRSPLYQEGCPQGGVCKGIRLVQSSVSFSLPHRSISLMKFSSIPLLALAAAALGFAEAPAPVTTEYGVVQGVAAPGLTVYKGIPFAAPPVGEL